MKLCSVCGHEAHAGKCPHLTPLGSGWTICCCGARGLSRDDQQAIANTFDVLRRCLLSPARAAESRAYGGQRSAGHVRSGLRSDRVLAAR